ncbi:MAG: serine hydrolase, partial [Dehalococcoidia bacterium]
ATAIVAAEQADLDEEVTSDVHYWDLDDSSTMGLEPGDVFTVRELLYGLMLVSGNDAAIALGRHVAGSDDAFVALMNDLVERLGLEDTRFMNASGLHHDRHYSSPWDLVMLSRALMRIPELREVVGTEEHTALGERPTDADLEDAGIEGSDEGASAGSDGRARGSEPVGLDLYNHNPLLNYTPGVDGVKTGFVEEAGRTFSVTAERGGHRIYIVLLDTTLRAQDSMDLIEWAFANHEWP